MWDEEQTSERCGGRSEGSQLLFLILICTQGMVQGRAMETSSTRQEEERRTGAHG